MTSLLSYEELLALAARGVVRNVDTKQIKAASIELTLNRDAQMETLEMPSEDIVWPKYRVDLDYKDPIKTTAIEILPSFDLEPGAAIMVKTREDFLLPQDISMMIVATRQMARACLGLSGCTFRAAGFGDQQLPLTLVNMTQNHLITLREGDVIGQALFFHHRAVPKDVGSI